MAEFLSPGVFIEEVPSSVQTIQAVSTSNMGIVGFSPKGPTDEAVLVTSSEQYTQAFGGLTRDSYMPQSVYAFYANGGRRAFVVRVVPSDAVEGDCDIQSKVYDWQPAGTSGTGDGVTTAFASTLATTTLPKTPVIGKNASNAATLGIRWRSAGVAVVGERVKEREGTTNVDLVDGTQNYEFRVDPAGSISAALAEGDLKQLVCVPATVTVSYDCTGTGAATQAIPAPTSGTVSSVTNSNGSTFTFDHATGRGSIRFAGPDVPDSGVVTASLTLDYTPTSASWKIADDGAGALVDVVTGSLSAPGTLDYNTGAWGFSATAAPHDDAPILWTYYWEAWDLEPISKGDWVNNIRVSVSGNLDYFSVITQSYTRHDMVVEEYSSATNSYAIKETYEELDMTDSTSAAYFPDVINELSDLLNVATPGGDAAPGMLDGILSSVVLGGGEESSGNSTFGPAFLLPAYLSNMGLTVGARTVSVTGTVEGTEATGSITTVAQANIVDNETFTLDDGVNTPTVFEFDQSGGSTPTPGYVQVDISGDTTADDVRDTIITVINGVATLAISASNGGAATVDLINDQQGAAGNTTSSETVTDVGFAVTDMTGGVNAGAFSITDDGAGNLTGDVDPAYATTVTTGGVTLSPNTVDYDTGYANFKVDGLIQAGTVVTAAYYTAPEEDSRSETFGDANKRYTDSLGEVHYLAGSNGTFTTSTFSRNEFTSPTLQASYRGLYALSRVDEIMQVIIPDFAGDLIVTGDLLDYAASRANQPQGGDRFIVLTVPLGSDAQEAVDWFRYDLGRFSKYAALYWPWVKVADPLRDNRPTTMPALGHICGVYARTDNNKNVGKSPGGTVDGALTYLTGLEMNPTQGERDFVYPNKINPLISSPYTGLAVWGVRTIAQESEWRYVNARRLFMFLEKSVFNATHWIVFENNGPALWTRIKGQLNSFLLNLFNDGYFAGNSPGQAFFIIVDDTNNTAASVEAGQVIVDIGVAPSKPAEFVRFRFQQKSVE